ncbi:MAG: DUF664 domain-containing protein [Acidimicrobiales bacterium]
MEPLPRSREWPDRDATLAESAIAFLDFVRVTSINKLAGLTEQQARATPLATSPMMSPLGLIKHLTAVQRQHIQIHIGGCDIPSLWRADEHEYEFRIGADETIDSVVAGFDDEWERSRTTLSAVDVEARIVAYGEPNRVGRLLVDVVQESARHLGHLDIVRELIDGATGE